MDEFSKTSAIGFKLGKIESNKGDIIKANSLETKGGQYNHRKNATVKLTAYLECLQQVEQVKDILEVLLSLNDEDVQKKSLRLILKLDIKPLKKFEKSLMIF
jgi:hypothetical protein